MEENKLIYVFILYLSYEKEKKEGMKMPYKVYCYTGKNGKKYVGQTCQSIARRAEGGHGYCKNNNSVFGQAIKKYGFDFFDVEILKDNLERRIEALKKDWKTPAGKKFTKEVDTDWASQVDKYITIIDAVDELLEVAERNYEEVEEAVEA